MGNPKSMAENDANPKKTAVMERPPVDSKREFSV